MFIFWCKLQFLGCVLRLSQGSWLLWCRGVLNSWGISSFSKSALDESWRSSCCKYEALTSCCAHTCLPYEHWPEFWNASESLITYHLLLHHQVVQLLETPFINLINYASLVTTNAARHRHVAGKSKVLLEFGLRRAQVWYSIIHPFSTVIVKH